MKRVHANNYARAGVDVERTLSPSDHWLVAGDIDLLQVTRVTGLADFEMTVADEGPYQDVRQLMLFTFDAADHSSLEEVTSALEHPDKVIEPSDTPLVVLTSIALSPAANDLSEWTESATALLGLLVQKIHGLIAQSTDVPHSLVLGDLSCGDLVILSFPRSPQEIVAIDRLVRQIQRVPLTDFVTALLPEVGTEVPPDAPAHQRWPGPVCLASPPLLAFRQGAELHFRSDHFHSDERAVGLRYRFRLAMDAGHEREALDSLIAMCENEVVLDQTSTERSTPPTGTGRTWDTHVVHGHFLHLSAFVRAWTGCFFNPAWRLRYLTDSITLPVFGLADAPEGPKPGRWVITQGIEAELTRIHECFRQFGDKVINNTQTYALLRLSNVFRASFSRPEVATRAADLLPFFRGLAALFSHRDLWLDFLGTPPPTDGDETAMTWFVTEFDLAIVVLGRAVRARVDDRLGAVERPGAVATWSGTSKTLGAYSGVTNLTWQILSGDPQQGQGDANAAPLPVCVGVGTEGRVTGRELFARFREYLERRLSADPGGVPDAPARLLVFGIPQSTLCRPEIAVAHSCHEVAELMDWTAADRYSHLRRIINCWAWTEFVAQLRLAAATAAAAAVGSEADRQAHVAEIHRELGAFPHCLLLLKVAELQLERKEPELADIESTFWSIASRYPPARFLDLLWSAVQALNSDTLYTFRHVFRPDVCPSSSGLFRVAKSARPPSARYCLHVAKSDAFIASAASHYEFVTEVVADIGMVAALGRLLAWDGETSPNVRQTTISRVFSSMIKQTESAYFSLEARGRVQSFLLHRWAIQAAAVDHEGSDKWALEVQRTIGKLGPSIVISEPTEYLRRHVAEFKTRFRGPSAFVSRLQRFDLYGGVEPLVPKSDVPRLHGAVGAFRRAWATYELGPRIGLILELWSLSARADGACLVEPAGVS